MNIVIYGTGGVGGYFGVRLAQSGNNVTFIARGKHLEAIKKNGLQLKSIKGDYTLFPAKATNNIKEIENPDLVIITTKTWQIESAAKDILQILSEKTLVISLLNGISNIDAILKYIAKKQVLGGLCRIISKIENFGIINHLSAEPYIGFGELNNKKTKRVLALKKVFDNAKISNNISDDIHIEIWSKFLFITTISALGGLTRATIGEMRETPQIREMMLKTAEEIVAIANAKNIKLSKKTIKKAFYTIDHLNFESTSSLQRDIMEGKPSELEAQVGIIHKMGEELGIKTPTNTFIYHSLLLQERKAQKP